MAPDQSVIALMAFGLGQDHNTRIVVFGTDGKDARSVADAIASEAFHNVSFVIAPFDEVRRALASP